MILDKEMELAAAQSLAATANSQNVLYLGPNSWAGNSVGTDNIKLLFTVAEAAGGSGTVTFELRSSANADRSGAVVHEKSSAIPASKLKPGMPVPYHPSIPYDADRYVGVRIVSAGVYGGKINIHGVASRQTNR